MTNSNLQDISVTILIKNSQRYLKEVLAAVSSFGEVIIYDTGSKDGSLEIARTFRNVKIVKAPFAGFGPTHNMASAAAKNQWILSVDSDEVVSLALVQEILNQNLDPKSVYSIPRHNYFNNKWIRWCGWYPDKTIRLYNKTVTRFSDDQVHEVVISDGLRRVNFEGHINHYSYASIADFLSKMQSYSTLFAEQHRGKLKSSLSKAILHGFFAFFKSYIIKCGFLDGYEGYVISSYNGHTAYYKYLKLYEANQQLDQHRER